MRSISCAALILAWASIAGADWVQIGTTNEWRQFPWCGYNAPNTGVRYQILVLANELGNGPRTFTGLDFVCPETIYDQNAGTFSNVTIYLCHTTRTNLSTTFADNYSGNTPQAALSTSLLPLNWQEGAWGRIVFGMPFSYNGTANLLVEIQWAKAPSGSLITGTTTATPRSDVWAYGPASASGSVAGYRNVIRLHYAPPPIEEPVLTSLNISGRLGWSCPTSGVAEYRIEWSPDLVSGYWTDLEDGLRSIAPTGATMTAPVPMFYQLKALATPPQNMVYVPPGFFQMGDSFSEGNANERPVHSVYVSGFYIDRCEVTKQLWDEVYSWATANGYSFSNPGSATSPSHPVHTVSWYDALKWCNARSVCDGLTPCYTNAGGGVYMTGTFAGGCNWNANGYRLPTEAEWEKAARGGSHGYRFAWADQTISHGRANYKAGVGYSYDLSTGGYHPAYSNDVEPYTSPAGSFSANGYGLYDISGNLWEWCWDWYSSSNYASSVTSNPSGPGTGSTRVLRGGSWYDDARVNRLTMRGGSYGPTTASHYAGFRCVRY